jgi:outer membrane biogenesis lipoprotein LolB
MRKVMQYIILLSAVFLLSACSSPFRQVKPNEVIESKNLSYIVPSTEWR